MWTSIDIFVTAALAPFVHCHPPFLQPHLVPHRTAPLRAHLTSWLEASNAVGSVVQKGSQALLSLSRVQPHHSGDGAGDSTV